MRMDKITDLEFIREGKTFPPVACDNRYNGYRLNIARYKKSEKESFTKIMTVNGEMTVRLDMPSTNYFKLVTNKCVGLLLNEKPHITGKDKETTDAINRIIENSGFYLQLQQAYKSFSAVGDGVFSIAKQNGEAKITAFNPNNWIKVCSSNNMGDIKAHVLYNILYDNKNNPYIVRVLIHKKGYYKEKYFKYDGSTLGSPISFKKEDKEQIDEEGNINVIEGELIPIQGKIVRTGIQDFAIVDINNDKTIDELYGVSDYKAFSDVVLLKQKKLGQLDAVTDKHYDPILQGPASALMTDERTGKTSFKGTGRYIPVTRDDGDVKYVTWNSETKAVHELINKLNNEIAVLSEMGEAFLNGTYSSNISGEALKTMIKSALDKVSRQIDSIENPIKRVLRSMLELEGYNLNLADITIEWQDGIAVEDKVKAETIKSRIESGTLSKKRAMMKYDGMTREEAEQEIEEIEVEGTQKGGIEDEIES